MMRIGMNVLLEMLPCFRNQLIKLLLGARNFPMKGAGLAHREKLLEECIGALLPSDGFILVGVEPLLRLPKQREW